VNQPNGLNCAQSWFVLILCRPLVNIGAIGGLNGIAVTIVIAPFLFAKAFCGELVPQDLHDEPAEKQLERIRLSGQLVNTKQHRSCVAERNSKRPRKPIP